MQSVEDVLFSEDRLGLDFFGGHRQSLLVLVSMLTAYKQLVCVPFKSREPYLEISSSRPSSSQGREGSSECFCPLARL